MFGATSRTPPSAAQTTDLQNTPKEPFETRLQTTVWLSGTPPYILYYTQGRRTIPVELQSFRPDPSRVLAVGARYAATVILEEKPHGIIDVRSVDVDGRRFVRVR